MVWQLGAESPKRISFDREQVRQWATAHREKLIVGALLLVLVILAVVSYTLITRITGRNAQDAAIEQAAKDIAAGEKPVTTLPQTQRTLDEKPGDKPAGDRDGAVDPFAGALLRGVILDKNGQNLAIIEIGGMAYIAEKGSTVAETWTVEEIKEREVVLKAGDREMRLKLNGRASISDTAKSTR